MPNSKWVRKYHATHPKQPALTNEEVMHVLGLTGKTPCPYCSNEHFSLFHSDEFPCQNTPKSLEKVPNSDN
jgi:hypothetical protein